MAPQEELARLISEKGRKILVAENPVDLKSLQGENFVYLLQLPEGSTAAGGRAGGFGERRVERLYAFHYSNGSCRKLFEVDSPEKLERFELPYHAAGMQVLLPDGTERIISGVVDPEFVASYKQIA
ncbi:hypothetical protein AUG19_09185 [archaeon 13_1_20CM_2_54_9]|nr:MAG: hypothetical protein AUJ07_12160 [Crenarchaeota archaeon 13_1_40CM_3_53_5]OLE74279.1 MAG: hypothetical protein AUG19_09185 [archaeon 13_1_20CM_2_54_9]TMI28607.1 MAG: hypothetical protein E6H36_00435 [Candidatus Bathyarchaeota archaeon]TMI31533.1 MAG: hypothetical protein E6H29_04810 [Candidatus Bathyarchaeota archaeon]